jgi:hypothetical protein
VMGRRRSSAPDSGFLSVWTAYGAICAGNHAGIEHEDDHEQHDFPTHEGTPQSKRIHEGWYCGVARQPDNGHSGGVSAAQEPKVVGAMNTRSKGVQ